MSQLKRVSILPHKCILCGLCEQEQYSDIFLCSEDGSISVANEGIVDIEKYPQLLDIERICPSHAIEIKDEETVLGRKYEAQDKLNQKIYHELRDYSFEPPDPKDYEYKTGVYQASKVPAQYRSGCKYRSYESAEDAGTSAFKSAVWSQFKAIARQYIVAYRVKQLKKYYTYEESENNYYFQKNTEISKILKEVYQLAKFVTDDQIDLPNEFCTFDVQPDWGEYGFSRERLEKLEDTNFDFERASFFHTADWYKTWVNVDDYGDDKYYYDFEEAEEQFREDMDSCVEDVLYKEVQSRVEDAVYNYLKKGKEILDEKINILQEELRKHISTDETSLFKEEIKKVCTEISNTELPQVATPSINMDLDYNNDYRFHSKRDCEKAAENRRHRAYNEGCSYIQNLPDSLNDSYMEQIKNLLTQWKRMILRAYDMSGKDRSNQSLKITVGNTSVNIDLSNFHDVIIPRDCDIKDYISKNIIKYGPSAGDTSYMSEYSCKISIWEDYDIKETIFGNIKEVNHRYAYDVPLYEFQHSALDVAQACITVLTESPFLPVYFKKIKESVLKALSEL